MMGTVEDPRILSAGIDIGTTTTQLIFSRLTVEKAGGFGVIPRFHVTEKEILYRSPIYFTPLLSESEVDYEAVKTLILGEYEKAGLRPNEISTGAVMITGESSRKANASGVVHALSDITGNFVVAAAGPNLESILAGKGSGAAALSEQTGKLVANLDIGGGTTNICFFEDGKVIDTACYDIGGRLISVVDHEVSRISDRIVPLLDALGMTLHIGESTNDEKCYRKLVAICEAMTCILESAVLLRMPKYDPMLLVTNQKITCGRIPDVIMLSGGIADCVRERSNDLFRYADIGGLLGKMISQSTLLSEKRSEMATETIRATVVGAGNYSMEISGSTIYYQNCTFPVKNVPVNRFDMNAQELDQLPVAIKKIIRPYRDEEREDTPIALSARGISCPSYLQIEAMATGIATAMKEEMLLGRMLILIIEVDIAKALGQALRRILPNECAFICIDGITCGYGDYIDLGAPRECGQVIPVIVKTLIFRS